MHLNSKLKTNLSVLESIRACQRNMNHIMIVDDLCVTISTAFQDQHDQKSLRRQYIKMHNLA